MIRNRAQHCFIVVCVVLQLLTTGLAGDSRPPRLVELGVVAYPEIARTSRVEGRVEMEITLNSNGAVQQFRILAGHKMLSDWVAHNAKTWVFDQHGPTSFKYEVCFKLEPESDLTPVSRFHIEDSGLAVITQRARISH